MNIEYARQQLIILFLKDKKKSYILIGIIIFTLIISAAVNWANNKNISSLIVQRDAELKKTTLLNQIGKLDKVVKLYKNSFRARDISLVIGAASDIAKESGVKLVSIKPDREEKGPLYTRYFFSLVIEANSYHTIGKFISNIEKSPDTYFIDALSIKTKEESPVSDKEAIPEVKPVKKFVVELLFSIITFRG